MQKTFNLLILIVFFTFSLAQAAVAEEKSEVASPETPQNSSDAYIYEQATMANLSQMYWALSKLDIENDEHVDNFMMINECDIYKDYYQDEFEWRNVREGGREYIKNSLKSFPLRFEFLKEIQLDNYDIETETFHLMPSDQMDGIRRFKMKAVDGNGYICGTTHRIPHYSRSIAVEFSRPFSLFDFSMSEDKAKAYIIQKTDEIRKENERTSINRWSLTNNRYVYLAMKVKIFASGDDTFTPEGQLIPSFRAILEGIDIYADKDRKQILYSKAYRKRRPIAGAKPDVNDEDHAQEGGAEQSAE
jgi:hypothetical protein